MNIYSFSFSFKSRFAPLCLDAVQQTVQAMKVRFYMPLLNSDDDDYCDLSTDIPVDTNIFSSNNNVLVTQYRSQLVPSILFPGLLLSYF